MAFKPLDTRPDAPWKQRYRAASIEWAEIATNNPARGVAYSNKDGIFQLYAWDLPAGTLRQITHQPAGIMSGAISADGEYIYYHFDQRGNEIGHYVRVPFAGGEPEDLTPDLTPYGSFVFGQSQTGRVIGFQAAGDHGFDMVVKAEGQVPRILAHFRQRTYGPTLSYDGEIAVVDTGEYTGTLDNSLVAYDTALGAKIADLWDGEGIAHESRVFSPLSGDFRLLATTSRTGYFRPLIWNPRTGERQDLALDSIEGEIIAWDWSPDAKRVLLCQLHQAEYQLYTYDIDSRLVTRLNHPPGVYGADRSGSFTAGGDIVVVWQDPSHPPQVVLLDGQTGERKQVILAAGSAPAGQPMRTVWVKGALGEQVHCWLATPAGEGPFPTILHTHGGPEWVICQYFFPKCQAWLDHGFAFMSVNYHGSTTFGADFTKSITGRLGDLEVQDMAAAYEWLVENHIAQADAVFLTGISYGGFLTLQGLGTRPDLWAGGMAGVPVADMVMGYEDESETLRGLDRALMGGTPEEVPERYRASSPITYAEAVRAPVMIIQGENDTRCPPRPVRAYEAKMRALGKSIEVHWYDGGHSALAQELDIEHQELMLKFAYRILNHD
ncbi:MAG: prolyl oligopeptidase family serine peptidase [Anaerolineae bacterium]